MLPIVFHKKKDCILHVIVLPQLESEYSECSSAMSSASLDLEGQTSECCGDWQPQDEQLRRLR